MARILFHTTLGTAAWGGCEELWFQAATILAGEGHAVAALLPMQMRNSANRQRLSHKGIGCLSSPLDRWRFHAARIARRLWPQAANMVAPIVAHARAWKADLVVVSQAACWSAYGELLGLAKSGIPFVTVSQLNTPFNWPGDRLFERVGDAFFGARAAVFVSQGNLSLFENQIARDLPNAHVIYNPTSFKIDGSCGPPPVEGSMVLLNVARLDPAHKGQDLLIDVLSMPKWRERAVELRIAGGGNRVWMERLVGRRGLGNVRLLGHVMDLKEEWRQATYGVFSSRYEGMPLAMIEGMGLGRAMIATDVAGHAEWIRHGENGFLAGGAEARALDAAMEDAWSHRAAAAELGARARAEFLSRGVDASGDRLAELVCRNVEKA